MIDGLLLNNIIHLDEKEINNFIFTIDNIYLTSPSCIYLLNNNNEVLNNNDNNNKIILLVHNSNFMDAVLEVCNNHQLDWFLQYIISLNSSSSDLNMRNNDYLLGKKEILFILSHQSNQNIIFNNNNPMHSLLLLSLNFQGKLSYILSSKDLILSNKNLLLILLSESLLDDYIDILIAIGGHFVMIDNANTSDWDGVELTVMVILSLLEYVVKDHKLDNNFTNGLIYKFLPMQLFLRSNTFNNLSDILSCISTERNMINKNNNRHETDKLILYFRNIFNDVLLYSIHAYPAISNLLIEHCADGN